MKKIVLAATMATMLTVGASADVYNMGGVQLGAASLSIGSGPTNTNMYVGMDAFVPVTIKGLAVGVGFDIVGLDNSVNDQSSSNDYTMGAQLKVGYSLKQWINWNVNLKAGVGYGVTRLVETNEYGVQYSFGANIQLYKHLAVGYKYKTIDTGFDGLDDVHANIAYAQWSW